MSEPRVVPLKGGEANIVVGPDGDEGFVCLVYGDPPVPFTASMLALAPRFVAFAESVAAHSMGAFRDEACLLIDSLRRAEREERLA